MIIEQFLDLKKGHRLRKRNGDGSIYTILEKFGHALLVVHVAMVIDPHEWEYENGRRVERLSDLRLGVLIRKRTTGAELSIVTKLVTEPGREYAQATITDTVSLSEANGWMHVVSVVVHPHSITDLVGAALHFRRP